MTPTEILTELNVYTQRVPFNVMQLTFLSIRSKIFDICSGVEDVNAFIESCWNNKAKFITTVLPVNEPQIKARHSVY